MQKDTSASIQNRNPHSLTTEMFMVSKGISSPLTNDLLDIRNEYICSLRSSFHFITTVLDTVHHSTNSTSSGVSESE